MISSGQLKEHIDSNPMGRPFLPIVIIFVVSTIILIATPSLDKLWNMSRNVMIAGNVILFAATTVSFFIYTRSLRNNNVHAFLRMIYGGMFAKMMICLFAAFFYIMTVKKGVSKGAIFGCMFLYFLYTFVEISIILKLSRQVKHVKDRGTS
jgi:RsiW-degrading membrane proteinase PrsW (M82 family)